MTDTDTTPQAPQNAQALRADLLRRSREEHARLEVLIDALSEAESTTPGATEGWSVKDHLAHLTWWEQRVITVLGGGPDPLDALPHEEGKELSEDEINAQVQALNNGRPLADVRRDFDASYQRALKLIETLPDDALIKYHGWIDGNTASHYDEHRRMLQAWRDSQG